MTEYTDTYNRSVISEAIRDAVDNTILEELYTLLHYYFTHYLSKQCGFFLHPFKLPN